MNTVDMIRRCAHQQNPALSAPALPTPPAGDEPVNRDTQPAMTLGMEGTLDWTENEPVLTDAGVMLTRPVVP